MIAYTDYKNKMKEKDVLDLTHDTKISIFSSTDDLPRQGAKLTNVYSFSATRIPDPLPNCAGLSRSSACCICPLFYYSP